MDSTKCLTIGVLDRNGKDLLAAVHVPARLTFQRGVERTLQRNRA